jgi:hypothetical protein
MTLISWPLGLQLFCTFETLEDKMRAMANLRHRVLPPQLLLKWPKEASFCQLLMHPVPETRPKMRCVASHVLCLNMLWQEKACFTLGNRK